MTPGGPPRKPSDPRLELSREVLTKRLPAAATQPSLLPEADREWILSVFKGELDKVHDEIAEVRSDLAELQRAQLKNERDSATTDLEQQRQIADLWQRVGATAGAAAGTAAGTQAGTMAGAEAGALAASASGKKWSAICAAIALLTTLANALLAQGSHQQATPPQHTPAPLKLTPLP